MRILFSADHHFDQDKRFDECIEIHAWMVELARANNVEAFVSCGDIYERASTPKEREAVSSWLMAMAEVCPVFVAKGNHDRHLDCQIMAKLKSKHPIVVEEACGFYTVGAVKLALMAWPERGGLLRLAAEVGAAMGSEGVVADRIAQEGMQALFAGVGQVFEQHEGPTVLAGHFMIDGSETSVGQPLIGQPMNVGLSDFLLTQADYVVAGHIHKPQHWEIGNTNVFYTGSPYRTTYGELEQKSVLLMEVDADGDVSWQRVPTPCAGMVLVSERWDGEESCFMGGLEAHVTPEDVLGADVRLRYEVQTEFRAAARHVAEQWQAELMDMGAVDVKLDEVLDTRVAARAPEVAAARSLADKLLVLWNARGALPAPERQERLFDKAHQLEEEAS